MKLNKILLAFGLLFLFGMTGVVVRTLNNYYFRNLETYNLIKGVSHLLIASSAISFNGIVSLKAFNQIVSVSISRLVLLITIIFTIFLLFLYDPIIQGIILLSSLLLGAFYMAYFHISLISKTRGVIRKRLIVIFIGEIILITSVLLRAEESVQYYANSLQVFVEFVTIPTMLAGLLIVFLGSVRFPAFLELEWTQNLISLYIVDRNRNKIVYEYQFQGDLKNSRDTRSEEPKNPKENFFFSRGVIGIEKIILNLTGKNEKIEKIRHGAMNLLIKRGEKEISYLNFIMVVRDDINSVKYFFKTIRDKFQEIYSPVLAKINDITADEKKFLIGFDDIIKHTIEEI